VYKYNALKKYIMHYKAIILVIYNESLDVYKPMKQRSHSYYSMFSEDIKVFYITFRENQDEEILEEGEFMYFKGTESFKPGIITKTMNAMKYINNNYSYDYVVRTNVSTIINVLQMLEYLTTIPKTHFTGGYIIFNLFYSGIFIVFSKDTAELLSSIDLTQENIHVEMDDVLIMQLIIKHHLCISDISNTKYKMEYFINNDITSHFTISESCDIDKLDEKYENVLCFRVRNDADRTLDLLYFDKIIGGLKYECSK
jgi:hypothetical protein